MSQENVEIVQGMLEAFSEPERLPNYLSPVAVWDMSAFSGWPEEQLYRGPEEFFGFLEAWTRPYEEWTYEVERILDAGENRVVALFDQRGKLSESGSWIDLRYGIVYTIAAGLVERAQVFASPDEALEAAGLSE